MPHKKAKRSVRESVRTEKGSDLAPGKVDKLQNEPISKSASRVFNSQSIREEWKQKKRKLEEGDEGAQVAKRRKSELGKKIVSLKIQPGESIQHFNRRVEDDLRPVVKSAVQESRALSRGVAKAEREAFLEAKRAKKLKGKAKSTPPSPADKSQPKPSSVPHDQRNNFANRPKEFTLSSSSAPKRLNDIVQAPPELKNTPRGISSAIGKRDGVLSMSQKLMMEQEREKAITRYRELKLRRKEGQGQKDIS